MTNKSQPTSRRAIIGKLLIALGPLLALLLPFLAVGKCNPQNFDLLFIYFGYASFNYHLTNECIQVDLLAILGLLIPIVLGLVLILRSRTRLSIARIVAGTLIAIASPFVAILLPRLTTHLFCQPKPWSIDSNFYGQSLFPCLSVDIKLAIVGFVLPIVVSLLIFFLPIRKSGQRPKTTPQLRK